jgi:hypothetical protein
MNAAIRWPVILLGLALASAPSLASTRVAIYAIIDDVVFEPSDFEPDRVWISGVFVAPQPISSGLHQPPARGHLYLRLNDVDAASTRAEWQALRAAAGTSKVVGFGQYWMPCSKSRASGFPKADDANCSFEAVVHTTDRTLAEPGPYPVPGDEGVVTVFDNGDDLCPRFGRPSVEIVADLREVHSPGSVHDDPPVCAEWVGLVASSELDTAFAQQPREREWADATEAMISQRLANASGLKLADLSVQCRETVCRIHLAFPTLEYQEATGNRLAADSLVELPGFAPGGKIDRGWSTPTIDYYLQRRRPTQATPAQGSEQL